LETQTRTQRLRYPTVEQIGSMLAQSQASTPGFTFLLPTDEGDGKDRAAMQRIAELDQQLAELERQLALSAERCRREGEEAGRRQAEEFFARALAENRSAIAKALEAFEVERQSYFRAVEAEVVKLALAIARKVLHREAQMDPLLLAGAVRSALDRLEGSGSAVLRVAAADHEGWQAAIAQVSGNKRPKLVEDGQLKSGECELETQVGTVELNLDAQFKEIERGFFDLLERSLS
jgi:flagellar assembly protein FliH